MWLCGKKRKECDPHLLPAQPVWGYLVNVFDTDHSQIVPAVHAVGAGRFCLLLLYIYILLSFYDVRTNLDVQILLF